VALEILAEDSDLAIRTLGDYELLEEIGAGEWGGLSRAAGAAETGSCAEDDSQRCIRFARRRAAVAPRG